MIREWRLKARALRHDPRLAKRKISRIIGDNYMVRPDTVYYYLFGKSRKYEIKNDWRERYLRYGSYQTPEYDLKYKHLIRRIDKTLPQLFNGSSELSLSELTGRIKEKVGISMRESTLEKLLGKYGGTERGPPVTKTPSGSYRLNTAFY